MYIHITRKPDIKIYHIFHGVRTHANERKKKKDTHTCADYTISKKNAIIICQMTTEHLWLNIGEYTELKKSTDIVGREQSKMKHIAWEAGYRSLSSSSHIATTAYTNTTFIYSFYS